LTPAHLTANVEPLERLNDMDEDPVVL